MLIKTTYLYDDSDKILRTDVTRCNMNDSYHGMVMNDLYVLLLILFSRRTGRIISWTWTSHRWSEIYTEISVKYSFKLNILIATQVSGSLSSLKLSQKCVRYVRIITSRRRQVYVWDLNARFCGRVVGCRVKMRMMVGLRLPGASIVVHGEVSTSSG